jgi:hypothetical protein
MVRQAHHEDRIPSLSKDAACITRLAPAVF